MGPAGCLWNGAASSAEWRHRANGQLHTTCEVEEAPVAHALAIDLKPYR
jgi:hypothetical protein